MNKTDKIVAQAAGPTLGLRDVEAFEKRWDLKLPGSYKAFLLHSNGGVPLRPLFGRESLDCFVQFFFHIDPDERKGIDEELRRSKWRRGCIPIALEGSGKIIFLSESQEVFLADITPLNAGDAQGSTFLAGTWDEFLTCCINNEEVNVVDDDVFSQIIRDSRIDVLDDLIRGGFDLESRSSSGETLAQLAAIRSNTIVLDALIQRGASLRGALHGAAIIGRIPMIGWLVKHGANLDERDQEGRLPEEVAMLGFVADHIRRLRNSGRSDNA